MTLIVNGVEVTNLFINGQEQEQEYGFLHDINFFNVFNEENFVVQIGTLSHDVFLGCDVDNSNNIYTVGLLNDPNGSLNSYFPHVTSTIKEVGLISKLTPKGDLVWQKVVYFNTNLGISVENIRLNDVVVLESNGVKNIICSGNGYSSGHWTGFIIVFNDEGNLTNFYRMPPSISFDKILKDNESIIVFGMDNSGLSYPYTAGQRSIVQFNGNGFTLQTSPTFDIHGSLWEGHENRINISNNSYVSVCGWCVLSGVIKPWFSYIRNNFSDSNFISRRININGQSSSKVCVANDVINVGNTTYLTLHEQNGPDDKAFIVKINSTSTTNINVEWVKEITDVNSSGRVSNIKIVKMEDQEDIYVVVSTNIGQRVTLMRFTSSGVLVYQKQIFIGISFDIKVKGKKIFIVGTSQLNKPGRDSYEATIMVLDTETYDPYPNNKTVTFSTHIIFDDGVLNINNVNATLTSVTGTTSFPNRWLNHSGLLETEVNGVELYDKFLF